jgi:hypothetical protein
MNGSHSNGRGRSGKAAPLIDPRAAVADAARGANPSPAAALPEPPEPLHFTREEALRYELAHARVQIAKQAALLKAAEAEASNRAFENEYRAFTTRTRALGAEREQLEAHMRAQHAELVRLQGELGAKYGVDLAQAAYDDETGRIYPNVGAGAPTGEAS